MLHEHVAQVANARLTALRFLVQPRVGIGRRLMRGVRALLPTEIDRRIPTAIDGRFAVPGAKNLLARPRFSSVPSTVKCSSDKSRSVSAWISTASKKAAAMSPSSNRSRFFVDVVADH